MCGNSSLSRKDIELASTLYETIWRLEVCPLEASINNHTMEEMSQMGKYATGNRATKAAVHFSKFLDSKINDNAARRLVAC